MVIARSTVTESVNDSECLKVRDALQTETKVLIEYKIKKALINHHKDGIMQI